MKKVQEFRVQDITWLNSSSYILRVESSEIIENIEPGNFAELKIPNSSEVFLRRPFSVYDVDYKNNTVSYYIKAIGKGTISLGRLLKGDIVDTIYPLGNSFSVVTDKKTLIIGGGSGIAPFKLLGEKLRSNNNSTTFLFGARTSEEIVLSEVFGKLGEFHCTTEDGSLGEKGLVTGHSIFKEIDKFDIIYTCGPNPMMKAVSDIAQRNNVLCEASLENMMGCGIGACLCCVTPTTRGNECVCTAGPVFNSKDLKW